jgi:cytochrome P450
LQPRHIPLLLRNATLLAREAWSNARRSHGRFAELQPAEANRYRRPIRIFLQKRGTAGMVPIIEEYIDRARRTPSLCLCRDVVWPCTEAATREMLGIPANQWAVYREPMLYFMIGAEPDPILSLLTRIRARRRLEQEVGRQRTAAVSDGLIAHLLQWDDDGRRFTNTEIAGSIWMILGGYIGTEYFLASALHYFADHAVARREFLDRPAVREAAIEELLRYFTPGTTSQRLITGACVAGGERYGKGDVAILDWAAGNFDASVFARPDEVDFHRPQREHLTFGSGAHYCLGAGFARAFSQLFLVRFLKAFPCYRVDASKSVRREHGALAGFETLPADLGHVAVDAVAVS